MKLLLSLFFTLIFGSHAVGQTSWEQKQDSLREKLIKSKESEFLKNSPLAELYIRGLVTVDRNQCHVAIPFDLHGLDCGAPDCYITWLTFSVPLVDSVVFEDSLKTQLRVDGCVTDTQMHNIQFRLVNKSANSIHYYAGSNNLSLIILKEDGGKEYAYLFSSIKKNGVTPSDLSEVLEKLEQDEGQDYPYRSTVLRTNEYERFFEE